MKVTVPFSLFTHIRYMMYTTVPTMLITLIIFTVAGFTFDHANASQAMSFAASLKDTFHISAVLMIVPVVTGILIAKRVAPLITLFISALLDHTAFLPSSLKKHKIIKNGLE